MKNYTKNLTWAVVSMLDRSTQDDNKSKIQIAGLFTNPVVAQDSFIPYLPNKEHDREKYAAKKCLAVPEGLAREISTLVDAGFFASVPAFLTLYKADPLRMYVKLEQIGAGKYEEPCKLIRDYLLY